MGSETEKQILENPFPGPVSLSKEYQVFGRDAEIANLSSLLLTERVVVLHGVSGAGKSSLLNGRRGICERFSKESKFSVLGPVEFRISSQNNEVENFYENFLVELFNKEESEELQEENLQLLPRLDLEMFLIRRANRIGCAYQLLVIDQFEDIFTHFTHDEIGKERFFQTLGGILEQHPNIWLLLSMREEYLAELDHYRKYIPNRLGSTFRLELLRKDKASEAILRTARENSPSVELCKEDVDALVDNLSQVAIKSDDISQQYQTGNLVEPLFLQLVCRDAWERDVRNTLVVLGQKLDVKKDCIPIARGATRKELDEVLARFYESSLRALCGESPPQANKEYKVRCFIQNGLISTEGFRNLVGVNYIKQKWGVSEGELKELEDQHLIRSQDRNFQSYYELAHDRVVDPIKENNQKWLRKQPNWRRSALLWENGHGGKEHIRLIELLQAQKHLRQSPETLTPFEIKFVEERKRSTFKLIVNALAIFLVVTVVIGAWAAIVSIKAQELATEQGKQELAEIQKKIEYQKSEIINKDELINNALNKSRVRRAVSSYTKHKWVDRNDQAATIQVVKSYGKIRELFPNPKKQVEFEGSLYEAFYNVLTKFNRSLGYSRTTPVPENLKLPITYHAGDNPLIAYTTARDKGFCIVIETLKSKIGKSNCFTKETDKPFKLSFNSTGSQIAVATPSGIDIFDLEIDSSRQSLTDTGRIEFENTFGDAANSASSTGNSLNFSQDGKFLIYGSQKRVLLFCLRRNSWRACGAWNDDTKRKDFITAVSISDQLVGNRVVSVGMASGAVSILEVYTESLDENFNVTEVSPDTAISRLTTLAVPPNKYGNVNLKEIKAVIALGNISSKPYKLAIVHSNTQIYLATRRTETTSRFEHNLIVPDLGSKKNGFSPELNNKHYSSAAIGVNGVIYTVLDDVVEEWDTSNMISQMMGKQKVFNAAAVKYESSTRSLGHLVVGDKYIIGKGFFKTWAWERFERKSKLFSREIPGKYGSLLDQNIFYPQTVAFDDDGNVLTGSSLYGLQIWDTDMATEKAPSSVHCSIKQAIRAISYSPKNKLVAAAMSNRHLMIARLDNADSKPYCNNMEHTDGLQAVAFNHDGRWLVSGEWKTKDDFVSRLQLWEITDDKTIKHKRSISWNGRGILALAFHPKSNLLAVGTTDNETTDGEVHLISIKDNGKSDYRGILKFSGGMGIGRIRDLSFSRDGDKLAAAGGDGPFQLWSVDSETMEATPEMMKEGHAGGTEALAFNPINHILATGGADGNVRVWNSKKLDRPLALLQGPDVDVLSVAWSLDGKHLAASFSQVIDETGDSVVQPAEPVDQTSHGRVFTWKWNLKDSVHIACAEIWPASFPEANLDICTARIQ